MILDSETQRQNLLRLLDRVQITGAEAEILVELGQTIRRVSVPMRPLHWQLAICATAVSTRLSIAC